MKKRERREGMVGLQPATPQIIEKDSNSFDKSNNHHYYYTFDSDLLIYPFGIFEIFDNFKVFQKVFEKINWIICLVLFHCCLNNGNLKPKIVCLWNTTFTAMHSKLFFLFSSSFFRGVFLAHCFSLSLSLCFLSRWASWHEIYSDYYWYLHTCVRNNTIFVSNKQ